MSTKNSPRVFLDIDGVLSDFIVDAHIEHGRVFNPHTWPPGEWHIERVWGVTPDQFWGRLNNEDFWYNISPTPQFHDILELLSPFEPVLLSSVTHPSPVKGRVKWIERYLPEYYESGRFILTSAKHYCASWNSILIDDSDENCNLFNEYGGQSILYPQVWNSMYKFALGSYNPIEYLSESLELCMMEYSHILGLTNSL
jgi:5'(3')-deoxyribonucleotidase